MIICTRRGVQLENYMYSTKIYVHPLHSHVNGASSKKSVADVAREISGLRRRTGVEHFWLLTSGAAAERETSKHHHPSTTNLQINPPSLPQHPKNPHTTAKMVKLEEVPDEDFIAQQQGPKIEEEDDWDTDSGMHPPSHHPPFSSHN